MRKSIRRIALLLIAVCFATSLAVLSACDKGEKGTGSTATITYVTGEDATNLAPFTGKIGSKIYPPNDPERYGYRFEGWELNGELYVFDVMPSENITLTAKWNKLYTVTFEDGGSTQSAQYVEGETIELPESPSRDGFKFDGWLLNGDKYEADKMPASDLHLTAKWLTAVTITFDTGIIGVVIDPIVDVAGTKISAPTVHVQGYYIMYWMLDGEKYEFSVMPDEDITLTAKVQELTNIPSMFIDLFDGDGNTYPIGNVTKDGYVDSRITLTNTEEGFELNNLKAELKGRGNGSWWNIPYQKKPYKLKFDKKQSLFGRPANKHWVLINCVSSQFQEYTMARNYLAYNMAYEVLDGIEYTTPAWWVDVYVNGEYHGVYLLCEHVRVGDGRVDIESEYGVEDTGYLVEYDSYAANNAKQGINYFKINVEGVPNGFTMHSPDPEDLEAEGISEAVYMKQVAYIKDYVERVYSAAIYGDWETFSELADVDSFVDMYLLHELFKNADTGFSSFYLYKKPGGKLYAGPAWDFDGSCDHTYGDRNPQGLYIGGTGKGSLYDSMKANASMLYIKLYQTPEFLRIVKERWKMHLPNIRSFLEEKLNNDVYEYAKGAMGKNFSKWLGTSQKVAENEWIVKIMSLKSWLTNRITWLTEYWA